MACAVLLAGGKSRRMGRDKLALPQGGTTVLKAAVDRFSEKFEQVCISVDDKNRYADIDVPKIEDIFKGCGPLGGLHAALSEASGDGVFLAAADLPFSSPETALFMMEKGKSFDICITSDTSGRFEPLFGWYSRRVLDTAEELLKSGVYKMTELYAKHSVLILTPEELGGHWCAESFENMNFPEDFDRLLGKL
ncbi:MAG: molybdenum cofactor guanylyltransferase [Oscillospiraceae bacterium]|nr:molybdenum cofactor guanylyltransferase [Oscillospiraceae bacterium]